MVCVFTVDMSLVMYE